MTARAPATGPDPSNGALQFRKREANFMACGILMAMIQYDPRGTSPSLAHPKPAKPTRFLEP